ncbi:hypothetical protein AB1N83_007520 [Pleurotus pulmonarius]
MKASFHVLLLFLSSASAMWFISIEPMLVSPGGSLNATIRVDGHSDPPTCFLCIGPSNYNMSDGQVVLQCPEGQRMTTIGSGETSVAFTVPSTSPGQYRLYVSKRTSASGPIVASDMVGGSSAAFVVAVDDITSGSSASTTTVIETVTTVALFSTTPSTGRNSVQAPPKGIIITTGVLCGIVVVAALASVYAWRRRQKAKRAEKIGIAPYLAKIDEEGARSDTSLARRVLPDTAPVVESSNRRIRYLQDQMRIIESEIMKLERAQPDVTNRGSNGSSGEANRRISEGDTIRSSTVVGYS